MLNLDARWEIRFYGQPNGSIAVIIQIQTVSSDETILQNCTHNCSSSNELSEIACSERNHSCSEQKQSPFCQVLDLTCERKSNLSSIVTPTLSMSTEQGVREGQTTPTTTTDKSEQGDTYSDNQATPTTATENTEHGDTGGQTTVTTPTTNTDGVCVLSDRALSAVAATLLGLLLAVTTSWLGTFIWQQRTIKNLRKL